jgi:adenylate cyclase
MRLARLRTDYGSVLLGSSTESPRRQRIRIQLLITVSVVGSNLIGVTLAFALGIVGIPQPPIPWHAPWPLFAVCAAYVVLAFVTGWTRGTVQTVRSLRWSIREEPPTAAQARAALAAPWRLTARQAVLWALGVVVFVLTFGLYQPQLIPKLVLVIGLSGVVVCAISYQLTEFALRPAAAKALESGLAPIRRGRLRVRALSAWALGSGVPIAGIFLVMLFGAFSKNTSKTDLFISVTTLAGIALFTGLLLTWLNSGSVTGPIQELRRAMRQVRDGDTSASVVIFDGSDLGELQAGFNAMTAGLAERERLQDLFGRHVGRDVAAAALSRADTDADAAQLLGGTEQTVGVLFVDVIGSTSLAARRSPIEVVTLLNAFFEIIVAAVEAEDGLVNKFEGDAVLAIFGAPLPLPDGAGAALRAARTITARLPTAVPELKAGIGVSYGTVVAGNVGSAQRYEYTVIGDPVNESARLSEVAKRDPTRPIAAERAIRAADAEESRRWAFTDAQVLRGRPEPTRLYSPH